MASNPFSEWTKTFGELKAPTVDVNQFIDFYKSGAECFTSLSQIMHDSAQAIARRQAEILRSDAEQTMKALKDLTNNATHENATQKSQKYADVAQKFVAGKVTDIQDIFKMVTEANKEAAEVFGKHIAEQTKQFSSNVSSAAHATKKKAA